ncbi:hypothetical protein [Bacteroides caecigallinarum]|uniref:hypothetical protein n=1 Tax=Bacteroides caecigallinarum TaxID=1411144 RepID=UPI001F395B9A|nr:hypothetical protein [Bacteroides caecigallinarum]
MAWHSKRNTELHTCIKRSEHGSHSRGWKPEVKQNKAYDTLMSYEKEQLSKEKKKGKAANRIISGLRFLSAYYAKVNPIAKT